MRRAHNSSPDTSGSELQNLDGPEDIPPEDRERQSRSNRPMAHSLHRDSDTSVEARAPSDQTVRRVLWGKHIFMITISAVLNVGFYLRSGVVLRTAGPLGVLLSFSLLTLLAWGVMQCITEMLSIWPVPGALVEFVRVFVDEDLALTVGVAYWFTYSITFAAIITSIAGDARVWNVPKSIDGVVLFFLIPVVLITINSFGVRLYASIELLGGTTKLALAAVVVLICMPLINNNKGMINNNMVANYTQNYTQGDLHDQFWNGTITPFDSEAADHWSVAFFISLSLAAFAFVGVEIPAATALEARISHIPGGEGELVDRSVKFSSIWISIIAGLIYILGALLMSFDLDWDDKNLPRLSWLTSPRNRYNSAFVVAARNSAFFGHQGLANFISVCILITALTAANTTLYVASRTLFSLTQRIHANSSSPWTTKLLSSFGHTNHRKVPMRALAASCCFCWVPFLYLSNSGMSRTELGALLEVLADMGSVSCITVWAAECVAFIRFYRCLKRHRLVIEQRELHYLRRFYFEAGDDYPYRSHGQPYTALASLAGCLFILVVADGAALWKRFRAQSFCSAYLAPIFFILLFVGIKVYRRRSWSLVDLSQADTVIDSMKSLDRMRWRNTADMEESDVWYNMCGLCERRHEEGV